MPFDYLNIKLPESKKTELNTMKIQQKMSKIMFCLTLYPDFQLAEAFAGVGSLRNFLPFHLGEEIYAQIRKDVIERRKYLHEQPMDNILQNLYDLWSEEYNINDLYNMITGKPVDNGEEVVEDELIRKFYKEDDLEISSYLTFANVVESIDLHVEIESKFHSPDVAPGIWWLIWYDRLVLKGLLRPFALMARLNEGKICYLQGVWPFPYLMNAIEKIVPLGYKAEHGNYVYLEIRAELLDTKGKGKFHKYTLVRRVDSPTG